MPRQRPRTKPLILAVACLLGLAAALTPVGSASAKVAARYPQAAVILWTQLAAHTTPSATSQTIKVFPQFRSDFRPTTLLLLGETRDANGLRWLKVSLPMRPNGRTGWVKAAALQPRPLTRSILIDLSTRTLRVLQAGKTLFSTRVAIGRPGMETPTGSYYITATFKPTERALGAYAFETSAYSKLSEWPGGGLIGLHGTNAPWLLGQAISHGCIRMSNTAALTLKHLTAAGTPLKIIP